MADGEGEKGHSLAPQTLSLPLGSENLGTRGTVYYLPRPWTLFTTPLPSAWLSRPPHVPSRVSQTQAVEST